MTLRTYSTALAIITTVRLHKRVRLLHKSEVLWLGLGLDYSSCSSVVFYTDRVHP